MSKLDELKAVRARKKELREQEKELLGEVNEGKTERLAVKKEQAACRKAATSQKAELRKLTADIYKAFSNGDAGDLHKLADDLTEAGTGLAQTVRNFAKSIESLEEL